MAALAYSSLMPRRSQSALASLIGLFLSLWLVGVDGLKAATPIPSPEQFTGFKVGADNKLVRWDKILEYMKLVAAGSDRIRLR